MVSAIRPEIYETPYIGAEAYKKQLEQCRNRKEMLDQELSRLNERREALEFVVAPLSTLHDIDVKYRLKALELMRMHERALADCASEGGIDSLREGISPGDRGCRPGYGDCQL